MKDPATRKLITQPEETIEKILAESEADHVDFEGEHNDDDDNSDEETITEDEEGIVLISVAERLPKIRISGTYPPPLFRNKRFGLDEMTQLRNLPCF